MQISRKRDYGNDYDRNFLYASFILVRKEKSEMNLSRLEKRKNELNLSRLEKRKNELNLSRLEKKKMNSIFHEIK